MHVVENDEQGLGARPQLQQRDDRLEEAHLRLSRIAAGGRRRPLTELRKDLAQLCRHRTELGADERGFVIAEAAPDRLDKR